ncbi:MAG: hypothetical protein RCG15_03525 [Candidatus Rickettsia vulgarisii]
MARQAKHDVSENKKVENALKAERLKTPPTPKVNVIPGGVHHLLL